MSPTTIPSVTPGLKKVNIVIIFKQNQYLDFEQDIEMNFYK